MVLLNILTLYVCLLIKYNPMDINRDLCSLEKYKKHKKSCGYSPELLFVEPNIMIVSWGQICDNPFSDNSVRGKYCLRKIILCLQVIYFMFVFCVNIVLPLLLCIISPAILDNIYYNGWNK